MATKKSKEVSEASTESKPVDSYPLVTETEKYAIALQPKVKSLLINSDDQLSKAYDILKEIKEKSKALDNDRKLIVKPINDSVKRINALYNKPIDALEEIEAQIKRGILNYQNECERKQRELEAKKQKEYDKKGLDLEVVPKIVNKVQAFSSGHVRKNYSAKVIDPKLIPQEYWVIDYAKLNGVAAALKESFNVPGAELQVEETLVAR